MYKDCFMSDEKQRESDDKLDAFTAVVLIALAVSGMVYWLSSMPA